MNAIELDKLATAMCNRLCRRVMLPGLGLPVLALACAGGLATGNMLRADEPPMVAQLPDAGQPPSPASEPAPAVAEPEPLVAEPATVQSTTPDSPSPAVAEPEPTVAEPATVQSTTPDSPSTTVAEPATVPSTTLDVASNPVAETRELSTPVTKPKPLVPKDAPAWIFNQPDTTTSSTHRVFVGSEVVSSQVQAETAEALNASLVAAMDAYLQNELGVSPSVNWSADEIRNSLVDPQSAYILPIETSEGVQYQKWVVLNVTKEQQESFKAEDTKLKQRERLGLLGLSLAGVLALTGIFYTGFSRRSRRYPSPGLPPMTMPLLSAMAGHDHNQAHLVSRELPGRELPVMQIKRRKSCCGPKRVLFFLVAAMLVMGLVIPAILTPVRVEIRQEIDDNIHGFQREMHEFRDDVDEMNEDIRTQLRQEIRHTLGHD